MHVLSAKFPVKNYSKIAIWELDVPCIYTSGAASRRQYKARQTKKRKAEKNSEKMMGGDVDADPLFRHLRLFPSHAFHYTF